MGSIKGGPSGSSTSTQTAAPWGPQQPYLTDIFGAAKNLYQGAGPQYYPGATTAPQNWMQSAALQNMGETAYNDPLRTIPAETLANMAAGNYAGQNPALAPLTDLATNNYATTANSGMLPFAWNNAGDMNSPVNTPLLSYASGERLAEGNPYLDAVSRSVLSRVTPQIQSQFVGSGMLAGPEAARASAEGGASAIAPFAFGQYQQEEQNQINAANAMANRQLQGAGLQQSAASDIANRYMQGVGTQAGAAGTLGNVYEGGIGNMMRAAGIAPSVQASQYSPWETLFNAGSTQQALDQQPISEAIARWNFGQELPYNRLNQYIGEVTGNYGGTTTLTQPYFSNQGQNLLSGAVGGGMLGNMIAPAAAGAMGGGPIGAGLGALMMLMGGR